METDYLVVGAGAMGMAFTDALVDHADVHVTVVDRRRAPGGHWRDAYDFVQLHQASQFYGVASTVLGTGAVQQHGPEAGLHERAGLTEIQRYFEDVLAERLLPSGQVTFLGGVEHRWDGDRHLLHDGLTGTTQEVVVRRRYVDATYLAPTIPATAPPPFEVADSARVITVNELSSVTDAPSEFVVLGSGKTATDAIVWLLRNGLDPDRIVWVRPREPWMLDRAMVQPDPTVITTLGAETVAAASSSGTPEEMFLRLEDAGVLTRIDPTLDATMAKTPTLARWELELLRTVARVVRLGHVERVEPGRLVLRAGEVPLPPDAVVVHCAASGLAYPPLVPIWQPDAIRLQSIRVGFPCFCAALAGYVEATRDHDEERNRLCPPNVYGNDVRSWSRMQVRGSRAAASFGAEPDIAAWANATTLNPSRVPPDTPVTPGLEAARARLEQHSEEGLARMAAWSGEPVHA